MATADRRQREKEQRRKEIIDTAEKLFYSKGFDNVSMDEIAESVELSKGSLYLHFKNKDSLYFAIVNKVNTEFFRLFMENLDTNASGGDQIRSMIRFLVKFIKDHREYNDMTRTYGPLIWARMNTEYDTILAENAVAYNIWLDHAIRQGIEDGSLRKDLDPVLLGVYISMISLSVVSPLPSWDKGLELYGIGYEGLVDNFEKFIGPSLTP